jgi:hypothetical protein
MSLLDSVRAEPLEAILSEVLRALRQAQGERTWKEESSPERDASRLATLLGAAAPLQDAFAAGLTELHLPFRHIRSARAEA